MKHLRAFIIGLLVCANAHAQFAPGQVLTATALNAQFARYAPLAGATFTGPVTTTTPIALASGGTGATTASAALANLGGLPLAGGTLTGPLTVPTLNTSNATITGGVISGLSAPIPVASGGTGGNTATSAIAGLGLRQIWTTGPVAYVDQTNGADTSTCGGATGVLACKTIQQAYNNVVSGNDFRAYNAPPTIKLASGQTYTSGLTIQNGQNTSPFLSGVNQLILDMNCSSISPTNNSAIYIRHVAIWLRIINSAGSSCKATLGPVNGSSGNLADIRGGGVMLEFAGGDINFASTPGTYPQLSASRSAVISTCPTSTCPATDPYYITGGGGTFASAIIGGSIQFEGVTVNIASSLTYSVAFTQADDAGSSSNWNGLTFTGSNVTGPQFIASKGGIVNTNAQTGSFSACAGNSYLPGSVCGQMGYVGGRMDFPGTPTVAGCGTGAVVQNSEPAFNVNLGSGLPTTSGTKVSSCVVTMSTRSNWTACTANPNDSGTFANFSTQWTGPTSTNPGSLTLSWLAQGYDPNGKTVWVTCNAGP